MKYQYYYGCVDKGNEGNKTLERNNICIWQKKKVMLRREMQNGPDDEDGGWKERERIYE